MLIDAAAMYHHQCCCVAQPSPIQSSFVIPNCHPHFTGNPLGHPKLRKTMGFPQEAGLSKPVVGLVVPLGYSFNLDGTTLA